MRWTSVVVPVGLVASCLCVHGCLFQREQPDLEEFQVNTFWEGPQFHPSAAALADGRWVVVWQSGDPSAEEGTQDGSGAGIFGRVLGPSGEFESEEFGIPEETTGSQAQPKVAALSSGHFAVVWAWAPTEDNQHVYDTQCSHVRARVFHEDGLPVSGEIDVLGRLVASDVTSCYDVDVAALDGGSFLVTWGARAGGWSSSEERAAVKFEPDDRRDDGYFSRTHVFNACPLYDVGPDAAPLPGGGFALAWTEMSGCAHGDDDEETLVQLFSSECAALAPPIPVRGESHNYSPARPTLVAQSDGTLFVFWTGWLNSAHGLLARHIGSDGQLLGDVLFLGNGDDRMSFSTLDGAAARPDGGVVLAGSTFDAIRILPVSDAGIPQGGTVLVNTWFGGKQGEAAVAVASGGEQLVVWQSGRSDWDNAGAEQMGPDGSDFAIFARILEQMAQ